MSVGSQLGRWWLRRLAWFHQVAIAVDQLGNALAGGMADETLSSRADKARERWRDNVDTASDRRAYLWGCILCDALDAIWKDHCALSRERDEGKNRPSASPPARATDA